MDARVKPDFFLQVAARMRKGADVVQGSTLSKNPDETPFTQIGDRIQHLIRLHQHGRAILGLQPMLMGSHGIAITREALLKLEWCVATGRIGDDLELAVRCSLRDIPMIYAPEWAVTNDLPTSAGAIRRQRRRWTANSLEVIPRYFVSFVRQALRGKWQSVEAFISLAVFPSFANLYIELGLLSLILIFLGYWKPHVRPYAILSTVLWALDNAYFACALEKRGRRLRGRDVYGVIQYLSVRALALFESVVFLYSRDWSPTVHRSAPSPCEKLK